MYDVREVTTSKGLRDFICLRCTKIAFNLFVYLVGMGSTVAAFGGEYAYHVREVHYGCNEIQLPLVAAKIT